MPRSKLILPPIHTFQVPRLRTRVPQAVIDETIIGLCRDDPEALRRFKEITQGYSGSSDAKLAVAAVKAKGDQTYWECRFLLRYMLSSQLGIFLMVNNPDLVPRVHSVLDALVLTAIDESKSEEARLYSSIHLKTCSGCMQKKQAIETFVAKLVSDPTILDGLERYFDSAMAQVADVFGLAEDEDPPSVEKIRATWGKIGKAFGKVQKPEAGDDTFIPIGTARRMFDIYVETYNQTPDDYYNDAVNRFRRLLARVRLTGTVGKKKNAFLQIYYKEVEELLELHQPGVRHLLLSSGVDPELLSDPTRLLGHKIKLTGAGNSFLSKAVVTELLELMGLPLDLIDMVGNENFV